MVRINLLPIRDILRKRELKSFALLSGAILASTFLIMGAAWWYFDHTITSLQNQQASLQNKLNELKKKNKEIDELKNEITRLQKQVDTIQKLTKTRDTPAPFLGAVSLAIPDEVWLSSISKEGKSFSLEGTGADNTVVVNFVHQLLRVREDFTLRRPYLEPGKTDEPAFFTEVKLMQIVASRKASGLDAVQFKITGNLR